MTTQQETGAGNNTAARLIVERIVEALERGDIPWRKPWKTRRAHNAKTAMSTGE